MNIGEKIKKLRIEKNLKQSELAEKSGLSRVAIGNYERGDRNPNIEILNKIANALDIPISVLITNNNTLTSLLFFDSPFGNDKERFCKLANIDIDLFNDCFENGNELPEDVLIKLIDKIFPNDTVGFLRFFQDNYELLQEYKDLFRFCMKKKALVRSTINKNFNTAVGKDATRTLGEFLGALNTYTLEFKESLYEYINYSYESNFDKIKDEDKLTEAELHYLYKKSIEYIDALTEKMKNEKKIAKLNNSVSKKRR